MMKEKTSKVKYAQASKEKGMKDVRSATRRSEKAQKRMKVAQNQKPTEAQRRAAEEGCKEGCQEQKTQRRAISAAAKAQRRLEQAQQVQQALEKDVEDKKTELKRLAQAIRKTAVKNSTTAVEQAKLVMEIARDSSRIKQASLKIAKQQETAVAIKMSSAAQSLDTVKKKQLFECQANDKTRAPLCARCGDGEVEGWEQCDDGNLIPGDGCDSRCRIESNFICYFVSLDTHVLHSKCQRWTRPTVTCGRESNMGMSSYPTCAFHSAYVVTNPSTNTGRCSPISIKPHGGVLLSYVALRGPELAIPTIATTTVIDHITCPMHWGFVETPVDPKDQPYAYAICSSEKRKTCMRSAITDSARLTPISSCVAATRTRCKEVCTQARFCKYGSEGLGKLVKRHHGRRLHKEGKVCCFKNCVVPKSWHANVTPKAMCLFVALGNAI